MEQGKRPDPGTCTAIPTAFAVQFFRSPLIYQKPVHLKGTTYRHLALLLMTCATRQNNAFDLASQQLFCAHCVTTSQPVADRLCGSCFRHACANSCFHSPQVPSSSISFLSTTTLYLQITTTTTNSLDMDLMRLAVPDEKAPIRYKHQRRSALQPPIAPQLLASSLIVA